MSQIEIAPNLLKEIADIVYQNSGIVFKDSNLSVLISRISSKLKEKATNPEDYLKVLKSDKNELMSFIDFVTTNFTSFFRNQRHFEMLEENVLPDIIERNKTDKKINIWSAGCSTGEETYSIAMTLYEYFQLHHLNLSEWKLQLVGSDISLESLFIAKEGKYPGKGVQKIDSRFFDNYFLSIEDDKYFLVNDVIKKMVKFDFHNLIYDSIINNVDITFCRNVLIYFDEDVQKKVLSKIYNAMKPGGYLFIGHSESLVGLFDGFKPQSLGKGIVYVRQ